MLSAFSKHCKRLHVNVFPVVRFTCKCYSAYRKRFALERSDCFHLCGSPTNSTSFIPAWQPRNQCGSQWSCLHVVYVLTTASSLGHNQAL